MHYITDITGTAYRSDLFETFDKHGKTTVGRYKSPDGSSHSATFGDMFEVPRAPAAVVPSQPGYHVVDVYYGERLDWIEGLTLDPVVAWLIEGGKVQPIALGCGLTDLPVRRPDGEIECQWERFTEEGYIQLLNDEKGRVRRASA